ncbi:MAG: small subunit ribosomal protein [Methanolobus sp.]|jgi:small subunit ribosomal protein S4|uniref:Small ribosomal subunit protein uS4 n=1 Tax=Methanolobus tindarius DSM 2278 TaxID=1090322 RepID=W9DYB0_METTI|nr:MULTISPECIES: 30S ribosomal protein S4 [Methanolobus]ETA68687.1 ribosomal protein S4/S9 [Methanolobus tindarius DSM 2278]MDK2832600.1 small subunit ribosomal protein [Methanolobus sp.]MDK2939614.1 small subunit ribosomal protein [Methanolobus sp.]
MGYPGKKRKSYDTPKHPWQAARMATEVELLKKYGLRNKKELWKAVSILRRYRADARRILAESAETELSGHLKTESDQILARLIRFSVLPSDANIDDILALQTESILERRLQTQVYRLGLARTPKQARQFITHGHIAINGQKATVPGILISKEEEMQIDYYGNSPLTNESHAERPAQIATSVAGKEE